MNIVNKKLKCPECHWTGGPLETDNFTHPDFAAVWEIHFYCPKCHELIWKISQFKWEASIDIEEVSQNELAGNPDLS